MKVVDFGVQEPYKSFILEGKKTVEGRLNKGKFGSLEVGDFLEMDSPKARFEVVGKNIYKSFMEMVGAEGVENVIPDKDNVEDAANVYYRFYTKDQEREFGVAAIKIRKQ